MNVHDVQQGGQVLEGHLGPNRGADVKAVVLPLPEGSVVLGVGPDPGVLDGRPVGQALVGQEGHEAALQRTSSTADAVGRIAVVQALAEEALVAHW